jgi:FKBP-type peptidyl-prolyl cis-trans isomerase
MNKQQKKFVLLATAFMMMLLNVGADADDVKSTENLKPKEQAPSKNALLNYAWAAETARESSEGNVFIDIDAYMIGVSDAAQGYDSLLSEEQTEEIFVAQMNSVKSFRRAQLEVNDEQREQNDKKIIAFAKKNKNLTKTASGLLYQELKSGTGAKPVFQDLVKIQYTVRDINNTIIFESKNRFTDTAVALYLLDSGIAEALQYMRPQSVWRLYLTSDKVLRPGSVRTQIPPLYDAPKDAPKDALYDASKGATILDITLVAVSPRY